eukprot:5235543-Amphidinium_carterae.1
MLSVVRLFLTHRASHQSFTRWKAQEVYARIDSCAAGKQCASFGPRDMAGAAFDYAMVRWGVEIKIGRFKKSDVHLPQAGGILA